MSEGYAETVRRIFADLERGNVDAVLDELAPEFTVDWTRSLSAMNRVYTDRDELRSDWISVFVDPWEWVEFRVLELVELDPNRILVITLTHARGRGSGAEVKASAATIWEFAGGKIARSVMYQSKEDAMEANASEPE